MGNDIRINAKVSDVKSVEDFINKLRVLGKEQDKGERSTEELQKAQQAMMKASTALAGSMKQAAKETATTGEKFLGAARHLSQMTQAARNMIDGIRGAKQALGNLLAPMEQVTIARNRMVPFFDSIQQVDSALLELKQTAIATGTDLQTLTQFFQGVATAGRNLGYSMQETMKITKDLAVVLRASGTSGAQAAGVLIQLQQAFSANRLGGQEFRSVMENLPRVLAPMAEELGKSVFEIRKMAEEGKLTAEVLRNALANSAEDAADAVASMGNTLGQAKESFVAMQTEAAKNSNVMRGLHGAVTSVGQGAIHLGKPLGVLKDIFVALSLFAIVPLAQKFIPMLQARLLQTAIGFKLVAADATVASLRFRTLATKTLPLLGRGFKATFAAMTGGFGGIFVVLGILIPQLLIVGKLVWDFAKSLGLFGEKAKTAAEEARDFAKAHSELRKNIDDTNIAIAVNEGLLTSQEGEWAKNISQVDELRAAYLKVQTPMQKFLNDAAVGSDLATARITKYTAEIKKLTEKIKAAQAEGLQGGRFGLVRNWKQRIKEQEKLIALEKENWQRAKETLRVTAQQGTEAAKLFPIIKNLGKERVKAEQANRSIHEWEKLIGIAVDETYKGLKGVLRGEEWITIEKLKQEQLQRIIVGGLDDEIKKLDKALELEKAKTLEAKERALAILAIKYPAPAGGTIAQVALWYKKLDEAAQKMLALEAAKKKDKKSTSGGTKQLSLYEQAVKKVNDANSKRLALTLAIAKAEAAGKPKVQAALQAELDKMKTFGVLMSELLEKKKRLNNTDLQNKLLDADKSSQSIFDAAAQQGTAFSAGQKLQYRNQARFNVIEQHEKQERERQEQLPVDQFLQPDLLESITRQSVARGLDAAGAEFKASLEGGDFKFTNVAKSMKDAVIDGLLEAAKQKIFGQLFGQGAGGDGVGGLLGKIPGFAEGGSFTVGGSGGTDSQLVAMRATPGEKVVVQTPEQQQAQNINVVIGSDDSVSFSDEVTQNVVLNAEQLAPLLGNN